MGLALAPDGLLWSLDHHGIDQWNHIEHSQLRRRRCPLAGCDISHADDVPCWRSWGHSLLRARKCRHLATVWLYRDRGRRPRPAPRSRKVKRIEEASSLMPLPVTAGYSPVGPGCQVELVPPVGGVDVVLLAGRARSDGGRDARSRPATRNGDSVGGPTARYGSAAKASVAGPRASLRLNRVARTTTAPRAGPAAYWGLLCRKTPPLSRNWPALSSVARPSGVVFS
jgi:hypothetical protein